MRRDYAKVMIGTGAIVGIWWFLLACFVILAVESAYLSPVFWISLSAFTGVVILSAVAGGGKKSGQKWEYLIHLGHRPGVLLGIVIFVMLVTVMILLYLPYFSSVKSELVRGTVAGLLLGSAVGMTYMTLLFRNPRPRFCEKCRRTTWHLEVKSKYHCGICDSAYRSEDSVITR